MEEKSLDNPVQSEGQVMDPATYTKEGRMYNYDRHPKDSSFLDYYFSLPPIQRFVEEVKDSDEHPKILDLGSGVGKESDRIRKMIPKGTTISVDISTAGVREGKESFDLNQVQGDINAPPFADNQFNGIHCKDVLVHVPDKESFIKNISRMLVDGGLFVLISSEDAYEEHKQYEWSPYQVETLAQKYGLELVSKEIIELKQDDWYRHRKNRIFMVFMKTAS